MNMKLFLILVLLIAFLLYWLLPKTRLGTRLKMSEPLFYAINITGIVCGVVGLIVSFGWPQLILRHHYYELILLPVLFVHLYSAAVMKARKEDEVYDEKQIHDMTRAAATVLPCSFFAIFLLYVLCKANILQGLVWFPIYIFFSLTVYSGSTLFYFRKT